MPNSTVPAAAIGLPSNIIPFPTRSADIGISISITPTVDFEPDAAKTEGAYQALCTTWQFAHLDARGMDRAIEEMIRMGGASRMVCQNREAIRFLYEAFDFLIEADDRMQASLDRVVTRLEARI